MIDEINPTSTV